MEETTNKDPYAGTLDGERGTRTGSPKSDSAFDEVQHPRHYNAHASGVECIEVMERLGANLGTAFKYLWRANEKHETPVTDFKKALWYLRRELTFTWEPSTATEERLRRVVHHEDPSVGKAMVAIFNAATSETGSVVAQRNIDLAIECVEEELWRLGKTT